MMMHRASSRVLLIVAAFVLLLVPVAAIAAGGFTDVDDDNVFKSDIQWLADAGVTKGCNPPTNTEFCPGDSVTREQMAAFMHRLAVNEVVDAKTALTADHANEADVAATAGSAANADKLDGKDSTAFATSGHDHDADYLAKTGKAADANKLDGKDSTAFLTKSAYDVDEDGVVDSAEVKIRHAFSGFNVDMSVTEFHRMKCVTEMMSFSSATAVVASGGLSLEPEVVSTGEIFGYTYYRSARAGGVWTKLSGLGVEDTPSDGGLGAAAVPIDAAGTINAGSYIFAISPFGFDLKPGPSYDYSGFCELTVTAYTGQGASTDFIVNSAG